MSTIPGPAASEASTAVSAGEPAWVRHGTAQTQQDYRVALAFEQVLTQQLTSAMTEAGGLGGAGNQEGESDLGEGSSTGAAGLGPLGALLPQALASGLTGAGGLGLAAQLTREQMGIQHGSRPSTVDAAGGSAAPASGGTA